MAANPSPQGSLHSSATQASCGPRTPSLVAPSPRVSIWGATTETPSGSHTSRWGTLGHYMRVLTVLPIFHNLVLTG